MRRSSAARLAAIGVGLSLVTTGCLSDDGDSGGGGGGGADGGDGTVEIFGAFSDAEEDLFNESLVDFEEESGIDVTYVPQTDLTTIVRTRVQGGNPPDIALLPQPGLAKDLANQGEITPLEDVVDLPAIEETLIPGFLEAATADDGKAYGAPMRMAVKSIVWYPVPEFEEAGYEVPTTWAEMTALSEQIIADGKTPWCIGAESGPDTGWVMTDWVEELMLRTAGPEVYDQWVNHEIPFDDPAVQEAAGLFGDIALGEGQVFGGADGILNTPFGDADDPMFQDDPGCMMMRQGNFITGFFPDDVQADLAANVGTFVLPPVEGGFDGTPILGGGDLAVAFNGEDPDVKEVMTFISSDEFGGPWAAGGGWLSPHTTFAGEYPDEITQQVADLATNGDVFRFDGSDLMPAEVGAGSFWTEMVAWIGGQKDLSDALTGVEQSWPAE